MKIPGRENQVVQRGVIFHPVLLGMYPILALTAHNLEQMYLADAARALLVSLCGVLLLWWAMRRMTRDAGRAALGATFIFILFFSYGHIYQAVENFSIGGVTLGRHRYLLILWIALLALGLYLQFRRWNPGREIQRLLNGLGIVLCLIPFFQMGLTAVQFAQMSRTVKAVHSGGIAESAPPENAPDVYYIILDAYTRGDFMKNLHGLDTSPFLSRLEEMGFQVVECSQSNYSFTSLSLASSLNMNYVNEVDPRIVRENMSWANFGEYIRNNKVRSELEGMGYKTVAFETGVSWTEIPDADIFITRQGSFWEAFKNIDRLNDFENLYLRTTLLRVVDEVKGYLPVKWSRRIQTPEEAHYERIRFILDELEKAPRYASPKFVVAHLVAPHPPFVFTPEGDYQLSGEDPGYVHEVEYLNERILKVVEAILKDSSRPPVIILQGDHGLLYESRLAILNAIYLPDGRQDLIDARLTPVNTFRLILSQYFGKDYPRLEDVSYLSDRDVPYDFNRVQYPCRLEP